MSGASSLIGRLIRLVILIQGSQRWTPPALADELGVAERTIFRDLQRLRDGGLPVRFDHERNGYYIDSICFLPPIDFTAEEACALVLLTQRVGGADQLPLTRPAAYAIQKLRALLPAALRDALDELLPQVTIHLASSEDGSADDVWATVSKAIATRRALDGCYEPANSQAADSSGEAFRFDPYELYFGQRAWYAIGLHHSRGEVRTLKLSRFTQLRLTDKPYAIPDDFSLEDYLGFAWRMVRGETRHAVQLRFAAEVAATVSETLWHPTQQSEEHEDGSITLRFEVDGLEEIIWWILSYGPNCEVEKPVELRERVMSLLAAASAHYGVSDRIPDPEAADA